jgi:hypothetical protein
MAGLVPAIHVFVEVEDGDARDERGHDGGEVFSNRRRGHIPA